MRIQTKAWCEADLRDEYTFWGKRGLGIFGRIKWSAICGLFGLNPRTTDYVAFSNKNLKVFYFGKELRK